VSSISGISGPYDLGDTTTVTANLTDSLPSGCSISWGGDASFSNITGTTATATFNKIGTNLKINAKTACQTQAINSSTFETICDEGDWSNWTTSITCDAPSDIVSKVNAAVNSIPGVSVTVTEVKGAFTGQQKDCCDDDGLIPDGERYVQSSLTLSAEIDNITIWGPPTIDETFEISGIFKADIKIDVGVKLASDFSVTGAIGARSEDCIPESCFFGSISSDVDISVAATLDMSYCYKIAWWEDCGSIAWTPASVNVGIKCAVSYNSPYSCTAGLDGDACLKDITFSTDFKIGGDVGLHFERSIYSGNCD
jgi:hypothetical protein